MLVLVPVLLLFTPQVLLCYMLKNF